YAAENPLCLADPETYEKASVYARELAAAGNSAGGIIECVIDGMRPGIGEPVFDKLDAELAKAIMSIGAVKGFEIGDGFKAASCTGLENNDPFRMVDGNIVKSSNHSGGILGGISDGSQIVFRAAVKPTPSISSPQLTVDQNRQETDITIHGRHDPLVVPRAVVVVEAMAALTVTDLLMRNMTARYDKIKNFYI
ncbi:MAG: chorismate synthase, partial [Lachnospiraceae bacterium]|nr:chorismate synthase [Lachnospiraceae bacterium]